MYKIFVHSLFVLVGYGAVSQSVADEAMNPIFHYIRSDSVFYMAQAITTQQNQAADITAGEGGETNARQEEELADTGNVSQENIGSRLAVPATIVAAIIFSILVSGL